MLETGEKGRPEETSTVDSNLAFAAFALSHSPCGDVIEMRLDDGSLVQWCLACADAMVFVSPGA